MIKRFNISLVLLLLLFLSVGAVCASEDMDNTLTNDEAISDILLSEDTISVPEDNEVLSESTTHEIDISDYYTYFNKNGNLISTNVKSGDTLKFTGDWKGNSLNFNKTINIVYSESKPMKNCVFTFYSGANGSTVTGLNIVNTADYSYGIFLNGVSNCVIKDCFVNNTGQSSYAICLANNANYNNVTDSVFSAYGITYGQGTRSTSPVLLCNAHHNYIANNRIECDDANAIYLSSYEGGPLEGGVSNYNLIYNNTIKYNVLPTSWAYGIQIMGGYNKIYSNTVIGAFRAISTSNGVYNEIVNNRIINVTGADYNHLGVEVGGEYAIVGTTYSIIKNNSIENAKILSSYGAIYAGDNVIIENNNIDVVLSGYGIQVAGSNVNIKNNIISTNSGSSIFWKGKHSNLVVTGNNITSTTGVGILINKESSKKMPGTVTITYNNISTGNKYAIDARDINASTENIIENNNVPKGKGLIATPEGAYDPTKPQYNFNGTTYKVTPENYQDYFEDGGTLVSSIKDGDILYFEGNFVNMGVIYINSAVKFTGNHPTFYNTTFRISSDGVWIENLIIKNKDSQRINAWGILVYTVFGATITNCDIEVTDPNAAYAIYVVESSDIDVINNKLTSSGDYLTYTLLAITVEDCNFINNTIYTLGTGIVHAFENNHCVDGNSTCIDGNSACVGGDTVCTDGNTNCVDGSSVCVGGDTVCTDGNTNCVDGSSVCTDGNCVDGSVCTSGNTISGNHVLREVYRTYGILMVYSSGCNVSGNKVNVTSKLNKTSETFNSSSDESHNNLSTNSVVGIDLYYNSHNNVFSNNNVYIKANDNYIYGMGVLGYYTGHDAPEGEGATNNQFINNNIVLEGSYFVQGIVIGDESVNTTIIGNDVNTKSENYSYGINLEMSQKSIIKENAFTLNSDIVYGIEAYSSNDNIISNNELNIIAKQAYAIPLSNAENNQIIGNIVMNDVTGENITYKVYDSLGFGVAGVYLKSKSCNNIINANNITSKKGYAILVDGVAVNNTISDNYLSSENGVGDKAIDNANDNVVEDNYVYVFTGSMPKITINYLGVTDIVLNIDADGSLVKFYIGGEEIGNATSANGVATLKYKFDDSYTPADYLITASVSKNNYATKEFDSTLTIDKGILDVGYADVTASPSSNGNFVVIVKDSFGNLISGVTVKFYRFQARYVYIGEAKTDNGIAKLNAEIPTIADGSYKLLANISGSDLFEPMSKEANLIISSKPTITLYKYKSVYYGNTIKYKARIKGADGKYVGAGKTVTIKVNGKTYTPKTDKNGYVSKSLKLKAGTYTVTVECDGVKVSNKITFSPTLKAKNIVKKKAKNIKFSVKLVNKNGKILKNKNIAFKVKGKKTIYAKTNKRGVATATIKNLKLGKYTIKSSYGGCTISNKITIKK